MAAGKEDKLRSLMAKLEKIEWLDKLKVDFKLFNHEKNKDDSYWFNFLNLG